MINKSNDQNINEEINSKVLKLISDIWCDFDYILFVY